MSVSVTMPQLGESVTEGTVTRWLKQEGEQVEADEPLLEVSTDKVDTEIPSPASGTLASISVGEDETVEVGAQLATIDDGSGGGGDDSGRPEQQAPAKSEQSTDEQPTDEQGEADGQQEQAEQQPASAQAETQRKPAEDEAEQEQAENKQSERQQAEQEPEQPEQRQPEQKQPDQKPAEQKQPAAEPVPTPPSQQQPPSTTVEPEPEAAAEVDRGEVDSGAYITPLVRKLAAEHDVDLSTLDGTGVGGRIRKQDVLDAAKVRKAAPVAEPATPSEPAETGAGRPPAETAALRGRTEKLTRLRSVIAQRMVESLQTSAQLTTVVEVDVTRIARLRQRAKADFERRESTKLSFLPFFAIATIDALKAHPNVNASVDTDAGTVTYHDAEHLGVAVDTERGLLVPVIKHAGDLNIGGLARKIADLAERTRTNKITPDELGGGTFTLTNTGSRGALFDTPIINQPQVAILGTGSVVKRAVVVDDADLGEIVTVRSMVYLALTYDHRIVDGADAAQFLGTIKERLQTGDFEAQLGL